MANVTKLRGYREARNLTLRELATELSVHHTTLFYWEVGKKKPNKWGRTILFNYFGVPAEDLVKPEKEEEEVDTKLVIDLEDNE